MIADALHILLASMLAQHMNTMPMLDRITASRCLFVNSTEFAVQNERW